MTAERDYAEVFHGLVPVNRLTPSVQQHLWAVGARKTLAAGQLIYARATDDGLLHFVLDGQIDLVDQGRFVQRLNPTLRIARRPLDGPGPKRYTARAYNLKPTPRAVISYAFRNHDCS